MFPLESSTFWQVNSELLPCDVTRRVHRIAWATASVRCFQQQPGAPLRSPSNPNKSCDNWWLCDTCNGTVPPRATWTMHPRQLIHMYRNCATCHCLCQLGCFSQPLLVKECFTFATNKKQGTQENGTHLYASEVHFYVRTGVVHCSWTAVFVWRCWLLSGKVCARKELHPVFASLIPLVDCGGVGMAQHEHGGLVVWMCAEKWCHKLAFLVNGAIHCAPVRGKSSRNDDGIPSLRRQVAMHNNSRNSTRRPTRMRAIKWDMWHLCWKWHGRCKKYTQGMLLCFIYVCTGTKKAAEIFFCHTFCIYCSYH